MRITLLGILLGLALAVDTGAASRGSALHKSRVSVTFDNPAGFTDVGVRRHTSERDRKRVLRELAEAMERSAAHYLREDLRLDLEVNDVDLAGGFEWWRGPRFEDVRIVRDLYPPRMDVEYLLRDSQGQIVRKGKARLTDTDYLFGSLPPESDPLRHDKAMFRDWVRSEFSAFRK